MLSAEGAGVEGRRAPLLHGRGGARGRPRRLAPPSSSPLGGHLFPFLLQRTGPCARSVYPAPCSASCPSPPSTDFDHRARSPGDAHRALHRRRDRAARGDQFFDEEGLGAALARCAGFTAAAIAERIETAARAFVDNELERRPGHHGRPLCPPGRPRRPRPRPTSPPEPASAAAAPLLRRGRPRCLRGAGAGVHGPVLVTKAGHERRRPRALGCPGDGRGEVDVHDPGPPSTTTAWELSDAAGCPHQIRLERPGDVPRRALWPSARAWRRAGLRQERPGWSWLIGASTASAQKKKKKKKKKKKIRGRWQKRSTAASICTSAAAATAATRASSSSSVRPRVVVEQHDRAAPAARPRPTA